MVSADNFCDELHLLRHETAEPLEIVDAAVQRIVVQPKNAISAAPVNPEPRTTRQIPRSQHARIRTWVEYGMTVPQVAEVYGVAVGAIERILRQS
jgi:hypothetical protein